MIVLPSPTSDWTVHKVSLNGKTYQFEYRFNLTNSRWMLDIYLDNNPVLLGQKIVESYPIFYGNPTANFDHGVLTTIKNFESTSPLGRDNFGIDKQYSLVYLDNEEWENAANYNPN